MAIVRTLASKSLYGPRMHVRAAAVPGDDNYSVVEHKPKPNPNADGVVQRYKYDPTKPDGKGEFIGTMPAFPQGWDDWQNTKDNRPKEEEEDEAMSKARPDKAEIITKAKEMLADGATISQISKALGVPYGTLDTYLKRNKQTPAPEPVQAANQEPVQMPQEPAETSIPRKAAAINQDWENAVQDMVSQDEEKYVPAGYCKGTITTKDGVSYPIGDWEPQDEEPIPYRVVEQYDLARIKLMLIRKLVEDHDMERDMPDHVILGVIGQIKDMEVSA